MKNITQFNVMKITIIFIYLITFSSFSQTYNWTGAVDNGATITQTIDGVMATASTSTGQLTLIDGSGFGGTSGEFIFVNANGSANLTITFDSPVNIASIYAVDADVSGGTTWVFTPTGGSNTAVSEPISATTGEIVPLNWTDVTVITITNTAGILENYGIDNIVLEPSLSTPKFETFNNRVKLFPNPSINSIQISGLSSIQNYCIYNTIGTKILSGIITNNEKINLKNIHSGLYYLKFKNGNTKKFRKQ